MMKSATPRSVSEQATGKHRENSSRVPPQGQESLGLIDPQATANAVADGYEELRGAVADFGGQKKLALSLGKGLDYNSKINEGLTRADGRHAQWEWAIAVLIDRENPFATERLVRFVCRIAGYEMPRPIERIDDAGKLRIVAAELPPHRRRALEREHRLPAGALEP
jgi:hypothetical protein